MSIMNTLQQEQTEEYTMKLAETFAFKLQHDKTIHQAKRHHGVYDVYVINGIDYNQERVIDMFKRGCWVLV